MILLNQSFIQKPITMQNQKDRHHWIPISLFGVDSQMNLTTMDREAHATLHQLMNYDMRTYSKMYRTFRRRHNHKSRWDKAMVEDILRMQGGYLDRYTRLDKYGQNLHFQKMNEITRFYNPAHTFQRKWSKLWREYSDAFMNHHLV